MTEDALTRTDRVVLFIAPAVFLAGLVAHPFVHNYMDSEVIAAAINEAPSRWAIAHLIIATGVGLVLLAALAIRRQFRIAGEDRWSGVGIAFLIVSGVLLGAVVGAEITLSAVVNSGAGLLAVLAEAETWSRPLVLGAFVLFVIGWLPASVSIHRPGDAPAPKVVWSRSTVITSVRPLAFSPFRAAERRRHRSPVPRRRRHSLRW